MLCSLRILRRAPEGQRDRDCEDRALRSEAEGAGDRAAGGVRDRRDRELRRRGHRARRDRDRQRAVGGRECSTFGGDRRRRGRLDLRSAGLGRHGGEPTTSRWWLLGHAAGWAAGGQARRAAQWSPARRRGNPSATRAGTLACARGSRQGPRTSPLRFRTRPRPPGKRPPGSGGLGEATCGGTLARCLPKNRHGLLAVPGRACDFPAPFAERTSNGPQEFRVVAYVAGGRMGEGSHPCRRGARTPCARSPVAPQYQRNAPRRPAPAPGAR